MAALFNQSKYESVATNDHEASTRPRATLRCPLVVNIVCILVGVAFGVLISIHLTSTYKITASSTSCWVPEPLSPIPVEVVSPRIQKVFNPDSQYMGPSEEVDRNWIALVDSDAIYIDTPEAYELGNGMEPPPQYSRPENNSALPLSFYFVSNLHQIHCLNMIRRRYWQLLTVGFDPKDSENEDWRTHVDHCIEYLRLGITCGDFLVIEPDSPPGTPPELTIDGLGWGVTHECIDFEKLLAFQKAQEILYMSS